MIPNSIFGALNAARQGMFASQIGISTAGKNIANVNTEGYSRQRVIFNPSVFGNGVDIGGIQRMRDQFYEAQLNVEHESLGLLSMRQQALAQIELIFNESSGVGISTSMGEFFKSLHDLAASPDGTAERETVRTRARALANAFKSVRDRLESLRGDMDSRVEDLTDQANSLLQEIATLNRQITSQRATLDEPNELIDQRALVLGQLSEIMDIQYFTDEGQITIIGGTGNVLVEGSQSATLFTAMNPDNGGLRDVMVRRLDGQTVAISDQITAGSLAGAIEMRDNRLTADLQVLDRLAAQMVTILNVQHRVGTGLDGISGRDLFEVVSVESSTGANNAGGVALTGSLIVDQSLLTFDDYEIRFTGPGTYDIFDVTTGTLLSAGNIYVSGGAIAFDGMSITLSNVIGPPVAGDVIRVNSYGGMAGEMDLSAAVQGSLDAIAAGLSAETGDNRNALDLANLENAQVLSGGRATFSDIYNSLVTTMGIASQQSLRDWENQQLVFDQVKALSDSISGVSIDEESTMLIQFERAFQASSRVIVTVDEMLQTIVNMV